MLLTLLLSLWSSQADAGADEREARKEARVVKKEQRALGEALDVYWRSLRWDDMVVASSFLADPGYQASWLTGMTEGPGRLKVQSYTLLRVDVGPALEDEGRLREATLVVQVEVLDAAAQTLDKSTRTQTWYRTGSGWFVEPGQELGVSP
jgi:hypothetical protein